MSKSIKDLKNRTEKAAAIQKALRNGESLPTVKANIAKDREILEHEDHMVHFDFIHHNFNAATGLDNGVWNRDQQCYPKDWDGVTKAMEGNATEVVLLHHPEQGDNAAKGAKKGDTLTSKQQAQKDFVDAFGYEPEENLTIAVLNESTKQLKSIEEAYAQLASEGATIEKPTTLEEARAALEELQK